MAEVYWPDIELDTGRFNVRQSLQRIDKKLYPDNGGLQLVEPTGGYSARVVTLPAVDGLNLVNWRAEGMNWWAVSDLNLSELEQLPLCPCFMPVYKTLRG